MRRLVVVGALVGALLTTACADKSEPLGPAATLPRGTTTTNPYTVPPVIDEAYVNRVLAGLDQAYGDLTRFVVDTRTLLPEAVQRINSLYVGKYAQLVIDFVQAALRDGLRIYKAEPGNQVSVSASLISVKPTCVFAEVHRDLSAVLVATDSRFERQWVAIVPAADSNRASAFNPTSWVYIYDGFQLGFTQPEDPCAAVS